MSFEKKLDMFDDRIGEQNMPQRTFYVGMNNKFNNLFQTVGDNLFKEVSFKQEFALRCASFFREPPTIKDLADFLGTSHQNTKQVLEKLEKKGYVQLVQDTNDRRKQRILITDDGRRILEIYLVKGNEYLNLLFDGISEEDLEIAIQVTMRMFENLKRVQDS